MAALEECSNTEFHPFALQNIRHSSLGEIYERHQSRASLCLWLFPACIHSVPCPAQPTDIPTAGPLDAAVEPNQNPFTLRSFPPAIPSCWFTSMPGLKLFCTCCSQGWIRFVWSWRQGAPAGTPVCISHPFTGVGGILGVSAHPTNSCYTLGPKPPFFLSSPHRGALLHLWGSGRLQCFQAVNSTSGFLLIPNILMSSGNATSSL